MPQAIERLLATPMINPRFPRIRPETSGMILPVLPVSAGDFLWHRHFEPSSKAPVTGFVLLIQFVFGNMIGRAGFFCQLIRTYADIGSVRDRLPSTRRWLKPTCNVGGVAGRRP